MPWSYKNIRMHLGKPYGTKIIGLKKPVKKQLINRIDGFAEWVGESK